MNCYIIDDEQHAIDTLAALINKTPGLILVGSNTQPLIALQEIAESKIKIDVTFLDIDMQDITGYKLAPLLLTYTDIIFCTAFEEFAIGAFELDVIDYLLKPTHYDRFLLSIAKAKKKVKPFPILPMAEMPYFFIKGEFKGKIIKIMKADVVFVESVKHYLTIHLETKKYTTYLKISELEENLGAGRFMRVHQSFLVNLEKIDHVEGNQIFFTQGNAVTIGPNYREAVFERINPLLVKSRPKE